MKEGAFGGLAYSRWDVIPVMCGMLHLGFVLVFFYAFPLLPVWAIVLMGALYSVSISWNINGISHNFIHNPYFVSPVLNKMFSLLESITIGFSQTFYRCVHNIHHIGNSDQPDEHGKTIDYLSIYRHGKNGQAEKVWSYTFLSFFRDDPKIIYRAIERKRPAEARWGVFEIVAFLVFFITMGIRNWRFITCFLPFWYLGHCLSYLNGYFEHYAGNPEKPIAWGVSTYHQLYNLTWFNNGYHAEHHYRPRTHWTQMRPLHLSIERQQRMEGTRIIRPPHALGFLDPDLPPLGSRIPPPPRKVSVSDGPDPADVSLVKFKTGSADEAVTASTAAPGANRQGVAPGA